MADAAEPGSIDIAAPDPATPHTATLHAGGEFDLDNCQKIAAAVRDMVIAGHRAIIVDLRRVTFIDAATVRTLLTCHALVRDAGATMAISNATDAVAWVLNLTATPHDDRRDASPEPKVEDRPPSGRRGRTTPASPCTVKEVAATSAALIDRAHALLAENRRIRAMLDR
ncbi:STAS domain-containing protein [Couchioplanes azureus]|uniref:STAS domain-containing protein n=1 Tax=Couchioplanes caeruleus TaxID=56438 RepID=UPI00167166A2|nr:STAS domain-containing protein [Couchioplanes caeruleus]GGQ77033.1 hypothetical protein GCM10010166_53720 [Couchioplanes caeruleus subsp. azureus]